MTTPTNGTGSGTTALVFQAPPVPAGVDPYEVDEPTHEPRSAGRGPSGRSGGPADRADPAARSTASRPSARCACSRAPAPRPPA